MKKGVAVLLLSLMLVLSGCTTSDISEVDNPNTTDNNQSAETFDPTDLIYDFVEDEIKSILRNPNSLQINEMDIGAKVPIEDSKYLYYGIWVDYSAQNGFGGYNRETVEMYVKISKDNKGISSIAESEYTNKAVEFLNLTNAQEYEEKLSDIDDDFPFSFVFSAMTYDEVLSDLTRNHKNCDTFENKYGVKEIEYIDSFGKFEGTVTGTFYANNQRFANMSYFWSESQMVYMNGEIIYAGAGQSATSDDIAGMIDLISSSLGIEHNGIENTYEPFFDTNSCVWELNEAATIKMRWSINQETEEVSSFEIVYTNLVNESIS